MSVSCTSFLQSLLSRALLNGSLTETNPCALLQRLSAIFSAVLHHPQLPLPVTSLRNDLLFHCGHTHCAGHALLLALLSQKCVNVSSAPTAPKPHPKEVLVYNIIIIIIILYYDFHIHF